MSETKKLRDFIRSHEMRYFVMRGYSSILVRKAFKVLLGETAYWVYFQCGTTPNILSSVEEKNLLFKTKAEAKAKADELKEKRAKENKEKKLKAKSDLQFVTNYLDRFYWGDIADYSTYEVKPEGKEFARVLKWTYERMPAKERDDDKTYIKLLERYIQTGTIYSQGIAFRTDQIVDVKYGQHGFVVQIELTNGKTITPASNSVTRLIKTIFGDNDKWYYRINIPEDGKDKIE